MTRTPIVSALDAPAAEYDAFVAAVGYESRARFVAESVGVRAPIRIASAFTKHQTLAFDANWSWFASADFTLYQHDDARFREFIEQLVATVTARLTTTPRFCVDISSLSRVRLAHVVSAFAQAPGDRAIDVDFFYSLAAFTAPPAEMPPNVYVGPITPDFAGWTLAPERPPIAIVGLGYEPDRALGAVEHVQPTEVWVFIPESSVAAYSPALAAANRTLLEMTGNRRSYYAVDQPLACFAALESLTYGSLQSGNPILFPFGPKPFALNSLLVGALHPEVAVWRVSPGVDDPPIDRCPSGLSIGLRVRFAANLTTTRLTARP